MRIIAALGLLTGLLLTTQGPATAAPAKTGCTPRWTLVQPPAGATDATSVSVLSAGDVRFTGQSTDLSLWTARWDGRSLGTTPAPPKPGITTLQAGAGSFSSPREGWELVSAWTPAEMAERWHGGRWTLTPLAVPSDPTTTAIRTEAIGSVTADDAWAVGGYYQAAQGVPLGVHPLGALIEHWDGTQWSTVPNPVAQREWTKLTAVTAVSSRDVWAVGYQGDANRDIVPLAEHWDGTAWHLVPTATGTGISAFNAVHLSGGRGWAVGSQSDKDGLAVPLVERWDGTRWTTVHGLPDLGNSKLTGVYAAGPSDVWATAEFTQGAVASFLHFDGAHWKAVQVPGPAEQGVTYIYRAVSGTSPHDIWAVGVAGSPWSGAAAQLAHLACKP